MSLIRRRYYFWLIRAYFKRWHKAIFTSLILGGVIFFVSIFILNFYFLPAVQKKVQRIGYVGVYTITNLPPEILSDASYGLTRSEKNGLIKPGASYKWEIKNNGREYYFHIRHGQNFHDGQELTADNLPLSFKDVDKKIIDKYTVEFVLHDPYSPLLTLLARPLVKQNLAGLGKYKIRNVDINGGFVRSITLVLGSDPSFKKVISFYPTEDALKNSYTLGDIDIAHGIQNTNLKNSNLSSWTNTKVLKDKNYKVLVTIFYNTEDKNLSDKKVRQALSYAVPERFTQGERAYSPIAPTSLYFSEVPNYGISNLEISKSLILQDSEVKKTVFEVSTTPDFLDVVKIVTEAWNKIGIKTKIKIVDELPRSFQILIYPIKLPEDPDQYTLWHSNQINNITKYKNLKIDKLLEDGRSISDVEQRIAIYSDFQKYLIDDAPATFLYFPNSYTLQRK